MLPSLGEARSDDDRSTAAQRRTHARKMRRSKLLFHAGFRAAESDLTPGLARPSSFMQSPSTSIHDSFRGHRAESEENKYLHAFRSAEQVVGDATSDANGCDVESLFASLLETIAQPSFPSLLQAQLLGDSFSGLDKAVQCYLLDQRDVETS